MKKYIKLILALLIVFSISACKNNKNNTVVPQGNEENNQGTNTSYQVHNLSDIFNQLIANTTFVTDNKSSTYSNFIAYVEGNKIISIFNGANEKNRVLKELEFDKEVKALSACYDNKDDAVIYILTIDGRVYKANVNKKSEPVLENYTLTNVEAISSVYADIEGKADYQMMAFFKTKDNKYYTDYKFSTDSERVISEITK